MSVNLNVNTLKSSLSKELKGVEYNPFEAEVIVIGAGGRGGLSTSGELSTRNGGGAGSFISASFFVSPTSSYNISIGEGGSGSLDGLIYTITRAEDTKISYYNPNTTAYEDKYIARGGGAGESDPIDEFNSPNPFRVDVIVYEENPIEGFNAFDGGSGGGVFATASNQTPRTSIGQPMPVVIPEGEVLGFAFTGSKGGGGDLGTEGFRQRTFAGGGGVLNSGSSAVSTNLYPAGAGQGIQLLNTFLSASVENAEVAKGGNILLGTSINGDANTGNAGGLVGGSGLVAIKYFGEQKIFGDVGDVFTVEDYTIHLFTGSSDITTTGKTYGGSDVDKPTPLITAQLLVAGGGGGRGADFGGGGAGALVTSSIILGRNVTYEIVVGNAGEENENGQPSYLYGFEDTSSLPYSSGSTPYSMSADGGFCGESSSLRFGNGGDSGQGYIYKNDVIVQTFPSYSGGNSYANFTGSNNIRHSGGGASVKENGQDATFSGNGLGGEPVGGTILYPWYRNAPEGSRGDSFVGGGGNAQGLGDSNTFNEPAFGASYDTNNATKGAVVIQYPQFFDAEDIVVTGNATASLYNGNRTWLFGVGTSSFTLNFEPTAST
jgi:hypothetical protein